MLLLSALFSGSETAYFNLKTHREKIPGDIKILLQDPRKLLIALLTGNTVVNTVMASVAAVLTAKLARVNDWSESLMILVEVVTVTVVLLIFGEVLPKIIAIRKSEEFAANVRLPLKLLILILKPIAILFYTVTHWILKIFRLRSEKIFDSEEELIILTELSEEQGTLQTEESEMIQSIFDFHDKAVHEIMTPRVDMVALPSNTPLDDVMQLICEKQFSKIPIYKKQVDDIKGILYAKDLLPYVTGSRPEVNLASLARAPFFVPENKNLDELLDEFKRKKTNIAIVVDEWGGTSGLVTLEDVVEEVIGELQDPYDHEVSLLRILPENDLIVDGKMTLNDLEEETSLKFPEDRDYDTLGGFFFEKFGNIPSAGDSIEYMNRIYTVKKMAGRRIAKVHIGPEINPEINPNEES